MWESLILLLAVAQITAIQTTETVGTSEEPLLFEPVDRQEYCLGPGDILQVTVRGGCTGLMIASGVRPQIVCMISGDGYLSVSGFGNLDVLGMTIAEAEADLTALARHFYPGISVGIALFEPRMVRARISGMVEAPSTYTMSAINRVSDLVEEAGGFSSYSSRRGFMYTAEGDTVAIDLYLDPSTHLPKDDPFVSNSVSVVFEICSDPVYILRNGDLNRLDKAVIPCMETWDIGPDSNLEDLLCSVGGLAGNVALERSVLLRDGESIPIWTPGAGLSNIGVERGDTLSLVMLTDSITVGGAANSTERVAFSPGTTTREYIDRSGGFRYNAHRGGTRIYRNGDEIARGSDALDMILLPGDVVEVPFSWISKNAEWIRILSTAVTIVVMIDGLSNK